MRWLRLKCWRVMGTGVVVRDVLGQYGMVCLYLEPGLNRKKCFRLSRKQLDSNKKEKTNEAAYNLYNFKSKCT